MEDIHNSKFFGHGDCILRRIDTLGIENIPDNIQPQKDLVLEHGESGHVHRFHGQTLIYPLEQPKDYRVDGRRVQVTKFVEVKQDTILTHEEHHTINIPQGKYALVKERELDVLEQKIRNVVD